MPAIFVIPLRAKHRRKRRLRYEMAASAAHEPMVTSAWESVCFPKGKRIATPFCRTVRNDRPHFSTDPFVFIYFPNF